MISGVDVNSALCECVISRKAYDETASEIVASFDGYDARTINREGAGEGFPLQNSLWLEAREGIPATALAIREKLSPIGGWADGMAADPY